MSHGGGTTRYHDDTVTEWEEILAQKGIIPKREDINAAVDALEAEIEAEREAAENYNPLEHAKLEELDEWEVSRATIGRGGGMFLCES